VLEPQGDAGQGLDPLPGDQAEAELPGERREQDA